MPQAVCTAARKRGYILLGMRPLAARWLVLAMVATGVYLRKAAAEPGREITCRRLDAPSDCWLAPPSLAGSAGTHFVNSDVVQCSDSDGSHTDERARFPAFGRQHHKPPVIFAAVDEWPSGGHTKSLQSGSPDATE